MTRILDTCFEMTVQKLIGLKSMMDVGESDLGMRTTTVSANWVGTLPDVKESPIMCQISSPVVGQRSF